MRCMKVVLPEPAMPITMIAVVGGEEDGEVVEGEGVAWAGWAMVDGMSGGW